MGATQKHAFAVERRAGLVDFWTVYEQLIDRTKHNPMEAALQQPESAPLLRAHASERLIEHARVARGLVRRAILDGNWQPYMDHTRALGRIYVELGASFAAWYAVVRMFQRGLIPALVDAYGTMPSRLTEALVAMTDFAEFSSRLVAEPYAELTIVEHRRIETTLEHRTHQLEDSNRDLEAFSYSVAHDLRAPLRAMNGFAQLLLEDFSGQLEPEAVAYLKKIQANATRMGGLIDALLGLSRLSRVSLQLQRIDLTALAHAVVAQLALAEPLRRVDVTVDAGLTAIADGRLLRITLDHLIGNAWKFTAKQPEPRISVGSSDGRTFFVRDNGAGFDMVHAHKLFTPFERMHATNEFPGTGIGLATVHRIVHRHGGQIWAKAQPSAGATFFFTLGP